MSRVTNPETSMAAPRPADKRDRLVEAARVLFHRQGFGETSLANIAQESGVPVGNVYYYFKTKEDIAAAVIAEHSAYLGEIARAAEKLPDARDRLIHILESLECNCRDIADNGCPMGSLCIEFGKRETALREDANRLLLKIMDWMERQLAELGRSDARALAIQLVSTIQGSSILSLAMHDPQIMQGELSRLKSVVRAL